MYYNVQISKITFIKLILKLLELGELYNLSQIIYFFNKINVWPNKLKVLDSCVSTVCLTLNLEL